MHVVMSMVRLTPQLMRTTVRLNVREHPDADAGFGHVVPQDTVVVALRGDLDGQPSDAASTDDDAWAHFVVSREALGWAKSTYLAAYDGCVAIPRRLVAAHADAAAAIRTSFRVAATHVFERGARVDVYLMSAHDDERTFVAVHEMRDDCVAGDEMWSHTFEGHLDEYFLSETQNPPAGGTVRFASVHGDGEARAWTAWPLGGDTSVWRATLETGGRDPPDGVSGTRDRALERQPGRVLRVRRGNERTWYRWTDDGGYSPL